MNGNENHVDLLAKSIRNFQKLMAKNGKETPYMKKLYESIKGQCLVTVYMSSYIKKLIPEEEMSGFILYLEERLKPIILSFDPKKSNITNYLLKTSSFRALNYLSKTIKEEKMDFALAKYAFQEQQSRAQEEDLLLFLEAKEESPNYAKLVKILRYLCQKRPSFHKKLFIFLLGIFPYLEQTTKDRLCEDFNFDRSQTLYLYNRIVEKSTEKGAYNAEQRYLEQSNRTWSYLLYTSEELEQVCESSGSKNKEYLERKIDYYRKRNERANFKLYGARKVIRQTIIADELNMPIGSVSAMNYLVKNVIKGIGVIEKIEVEKKGLLALAKKAVRVDNLRRFEPFVEFGLEEPVARWKE